MDKFYSFNEKLAVKYGINGAVLLSRFMYFIEKKYNEGKKEQLKEGRYWTYESNKSLLKQFPFWTERNLRTIIKNLEKSGAIVIGNYNKSQYDRTKWYAFTDNFLSEFCVEWTRQNSQIDLSEVTNGSDGSDEPIPITNTITNTVTAITPLSPKGEKEKEKEKSPIQHEMIYFRCSDREWELAAEWYRKKGQNVNLMPIVMEIVDNWMQEGATTNAKKAREQETHYLRLYRPGFLEQAQKFLNVRNGKTQFGHKTKEEKAQEVYAKFLGEDKNIIDI